MMTERRALVVVDEARQYQCKLRGRKSGPIIGVTDRHDDGGAPLEVEAMLHKPLSLDERQP